MNTVQLECFVAVAEHLNFSRASEELKITQPAISHQIRSLEEELNVKLFNRTSKSVRLTEEGLSFLADARLILNTALTAKERLSKRERFISFAVGCHNHMELDLLPSVLHTLVGEFPRLHPSLRLVPFPSLLGLVENKQIHAAFGIWENKGQKNASLLFARLWSAPVACVCAPDFPLAAHPSLTQQQLQGDIIVSSPRQLSSTVFQIQNRLLGRQTTAQQYFTDNVESAFTLAKAGLGYTLYPDLLPAREAGLRYIPVTDLPQIPFGIYYRRDDDHPVLRRFLALCRESAQAVRDQA